MNFGEPAHALVVSSDPDAPLAARIFSAAGPLTAERTEGSPPGWRVDPAALVGLVQRRGDVTLVPPAGLRLDLKPAAAARARSAAAPDDRRPKAEG